MSAIALVMSPMNESRVDAEILPVSNRLSKARFFLVAISYSSFNRLNVYFHEINLGHRKFLSQNKR